MNNYAIKANVSLKLILFCILLLAIVANGLQLRYDKLSHKVPSGDVNVDHKYSVSPGVVFGACKTNSYNENETYCSFGMETRSNIGSPDHVRICNFTHTARYHDPYGLEPGQLAQVVAIDEDKAVFSIQYYLGYADLSIIHFSDCRVIPILNLTEMHYPDVQAPLNGTFEIAGNKLSLSLRAVVDFDGNVLDQPREDHVAKYAQAVVRSPTRGHLVVRADGNDGTLNVDAFNYEGSMERLKRYSIDQPTYEEGPYEKYAVSSTHQLISVCGQRQSTVLCGQFDQDGVLKFETTIAIAESPKKYFYNVYNLQGGGFLFVSFRCVDGKFYYCSEIVDYITVTKFDDTGRKVGNLDIREIQRFPRGNVRDWRFFVNEHKEMCLSYLSTYRAESTKVNLEVVCFKAEDLSLQ